MRITLARCLPLALAALAALPAASATPVERGKRVQPR